MNEKCGFMKQSTKSISKKLIREYMSSLSLFESQYKVNSCGMIKIIPSDKLSSFIIQHYYMADSFKDKSLPVYKIHEQFKFNNLPLDKYPNISNNTNNICDNWINKTNNIFKDKTLIRFHASKKIFFIDDGWKRAIPTMQVFIAHGFDTSDVKIITNENDFSSIPTGPDLF